MPFITTNGIETYYESTGDGPPLVLVHGGFVDSRMWAPQVEHFADRCRVVTYDLRGHGQTGPSAVHRYRVGLFADDLRALLDALGIGRAAVCGLSLGGMVAQAFAATSPDRLRALALADTAAATALTLAEKAQRYLLFPEWAMQATLRAVGVRRFVEFTFWLAARTRSEDWLGRDEAVRRYVKTAMRSVEPPEYRKLYGLLYNVPEQDLSRIGVPALVVYGEHESASVKRHADVLRSRLRGAAKVEVPGAGHMPNIERPDLFNEVLDAWLDRAT